MPKPNATMPIFMTLKTPKLKYSDSGFLKRFQDKIQIELYNAGTPILTIEINNKICLNKICYNKTVFNSEFLGNFYYNNFLKNIVLFNPIYSGKNRLKKANGFSQLLNTISYDVAGNSAVFRDKETGVLIKIKKLGL